MWKYFRQPGTAERWTDMQELEKIFKEIDTYSLEFVMFGGKSDAYISSKWVKDIIRNHMNDGWIPVEERLPIPNKEIWVTVKRNGNVFTSTDGMTEKGHFWNYEKENILAWKEKELIPEPYRPERSMN